MRLFSFLFGGNNGSNSNYQKPIKAKEVHKIIRRKPQLPKIREYNLLDLISGKYAEYRNINSMMGKLAGVLKKGNYTGDLDEARERLEKITDKYAGVNSGRNELRRNLVTLESLIGIRKRYDDLNPFYKKNYVNFNQFVREYGKEDNAEVKEKYQINGIYITEEGRLDFESLKKFRFYNNPAKLRLVAAA